MGGGGAGFCGLFRGLGGWRVLWTVLARESPEGSLLETIHRYYDSRIGLAAFVVDGDEQVVGMVSDVEARRVPKERWAATPSRAAMRPVGGIETVAPETDLATALEKMTASQQEQMPVVAEGRLVGCLGRLQIVGLLAGRGAAAG